MTPMTTRCSGPLLVLALYVVVGHGPNPVIHMEQSAPADAFPQVCRVVMPEDLDR